MENPTRNEDYDYKNDTNYKIFVEFMAKMIEKYGYLDEEEADNSDTDNPNEDCGKENNL